jgi:hypothetical protein
MMDDNTGSVDTGNPTGAQPAGNVGAEASNAPWYGTMPDEVRGFVENKGWRNPEDAVSGYINLEKFLGADKAGRGLVLPKDDNPDEWNQIYDKLGRPKSPEEYNLNVPEGDTGEFAQMAAKTFHELGLTAKQAEALSGWYNEQSQTMMQSQQDAMLQQSESEIESLKQEWGPKFDEKVAAGQRAAREFGVGADILEKIESSVGARAMIDFFSQVGQLIGEDKFVNGESSGKFGMSPEAARSRISQLKNDTEWSSKYLNGNADARAELERLMKSAYPE